ncbi:MAG: tripartite tricarboxylate transporter substrate binding protein [Rhodovarius sp.]|nr:tripartite tricarboxylate transporter substrate binding protein [Rhodovarius sp.]MDW8313381.1 tripartite tricarboxylate transporter substrate binding protein [Rhodovarius sp.]
MAPKTAQAQPSWPERPPTLVVPFPGGNASDILARIVAERLGERLGQRFVIDNRPGAGGNIGTRHAAQQPRDGYTFLFGASGPLAINRSLFDNLGYDPVRDLEPIGMVAMTTNVLAVGRHFAARSVSDYIALARRDPGRLTYGSVGNGSSQHLAGVLFGELAGVELTHVPYRAAAQLVPDLVTGRLDSSFQLIPNMRAQLRSGDVRALAVMAEQRLALLPEVPTMAEAGVAGALSAGWFALMAPRGIPASIGERMREELRIAMAEPELRRRLTEAGGEPAYLDAEATALFIEQEAERWGAVIRRRGIKPD